MPPAGGEVPSGIFSIKTLNPYQNRFVSSGSDSRRQVFTLTRMVRGLSADGQSKPEL